jgi:hypothetical protein
MQKLFNDFDATAENEWSELRLRRWDLSASAPADAAAYSQLVGHARYLRIAIVRVRPGRALNFEAQLKIGKEALVQSLGDLDKIKPLQEVLGPAYASYQKFAAESITGTEVVIGRFLPELSNPPAEVVEVDAKFWRPAPPPAPKAATN